MSVKLTNPNQINQILLSIKKNKNKKTKKKMWLNFYLHMFSATSTFVEYPLKKSEEEVMQQMLNVNVFWRISAHRE